MRLIFLPSSIKDRYGQDNIIWHGKLPARGSKDGIIVFALVTPKLPSTIVVEPKRSVAKRETLWNQCCPNLVVIHLLLGNL